MQSKQTQEWWKNNTQKKTKHVTSRVACKSKQLNVERVEGGREQTIMNAFRFFVLFVLSFNFILELKVSKRLLLSTGAGTRHRPSEEPSQEIILGDNKIWKPRLAYKAVIGRPRHRHTCKTL